MEDKQAERYKTGMLGRDDDEVQARLIDITHRHRHRRWKACPYCMHPPEGEGKWTGTETRPTT